jgi:hypothetical protein
LFQTWIGTRAGAKVPNAPETAAEIRAYELETSPFFSFLFFLGNIYCPLFPDGRSKAPGLKSQRLCAFASLKSPLHIRDYSTRISAVSKADSGHFMVTSHRNPWNLEKARLQFLDMNLQNIINRTFVKQKRNE